MSFFLGGCSDKSGGILETKSGGMVEEPIRIMHLRSLLLLGREGADGKNVPVSGAVGERRVTWDIESKVTKEDK